MGEKADANFSGVLSARVFAPGGHLSFRDESLCFEHFCRKSYDFLDSVERHLQSSPSSPACTAEQLKLADECARRALDICLSKTILNNLERARLLDILLWSGDVVSCAGNRSVANLKNLANTDNEFRRLGTGGVLPN